MILSPSHMIPILLWFVFMHCFPLKADDSINANIDPDSIIYKINEFTKDEQYIEAEILIRDFLSIYQGNSDVQMMLCRNLAWQGHFDSAHAAAESLQQYPELFILLKADLFWYQNLPDSVCVWYSKITFPVSASDSTIIQHRSDICNPSKKKPNLFIKRAGLNLYTFHDKSRYITERLFDSHCLLKYRDNISVGLRIGNFSKEFQYDAYNEYLSELSISFLLRNQIVLNTSATYTEQSKILYKSRYNLGADWYAHKHLAYSLSLIALQYDTFIFQIIPAILWENRISNGQLSLSIPVETNAPIGILLTSNFKWKNVTIHSGIALGSLKDQPQLNIDDDYMGISPFSGISFFLLPHIKSSMKIGYQNSKDGQGLFAELSVFWEKKQ